MKAQNSETNKIRIEKINDFEPVEGRGIFNKIEIEFRYPKRDNYMSFPDMIQDVRTNSLVKLLKSFKTRRFRAWTVSELKTRGLSDEKFREIIYDHSQI
jgi:hypothetical protein